jgi:hypothetical protein
MSWNIKEIIETTCTVQQCKLYFFISSDKLNTLLADLLYFYSLSPAIFKQLSSHSQCPDSTRTHFCFVLNNFDMVHFHNRYLFLIVCLFVCYFVYLSHVSLLPVPLWRWTTLPIPFRNQYLAIVFITTITILVVHRILYFTFG